MTTQATSPHTTTTTSPQWDSRNSGFIPPTKLQQLRASAPSHQFTSHPGKPPFSDTMAPIAEQRPPPASPQHARSTSFFSFRNKPQHPESQQVPRPVSTNLVPQANGISHVVNTMTYNSQPPTNPNQSQAAQPQSQMVTEDGVVQDRGPKGPTTHPVGSFPRPTLSGPSSQPASAPPVQPPPLHPEIRSVVQLNAAHAHKIYFSGPLVRRIERQPDGQKPAKDDGWTDVWAQLGGTTLSLWDMRLIKEASKLGKEVPPSYVNMTDAVRFIA